MLRSEPSSIVVLAIIVLVTAAACGGSDGASGPAEGPDVSPAAESTSSEPLPAASESSSQAAGPDFGPPLVAPERYYGVYANPDVPNREWFVAEAKRPAYAEQAPEIPPGHLAIGALFGDVSPWTMKTLSETRFEQVWVNEYQPAPVTVEFELDGEGKAIAMTFVDEATASQGRLERVADLPDDWR